MHRLRERTALEQLTERRTPHLGLDARVVRRAARHWIHGHDTIWDIVNRFLSPFPRRSYGPFPSSPVLTASGTPAVPGS